ncbi:MAG: Fur family transcriptional regulator [Lentisphaeria bacterium]|jgi:Fur family peroxide stress response transcriptional regulator
MNPTDSQPNPNPTPQQRLAQFQQACRQLGLRATHQRSEIFRELAATSEHPDAETLCRRVRARIPELSLDTVYRNLRLLEEKGLVLKLAGTADRARFDANTAEHPHFLCTRCGRVLDLPATTLPHLPPQLAGTEIGTVESVQIELRGRCRTCRDAAAGQPQSPAPVPNPHRRPSHP